MHPYFQGAPIVTQNMSFTLSCVCIDSLGGPSGPVCLDEPIIHRWLCGSVSEDITDLDCPGEHEPVFGGALAPQNGAIHALMVVSNSLCNTHKHTHIYLLLIYIRNIKQITLNTLYHTSCGAKAPSNTILWSAWWLRP